MQILRVHVHFSEIYHKTLQMLSSRLSLHRSLPSLARSCHGHVQEAAFDFPNYKLHRMDEGPPTSTTITREESLRLYREMVCIRRLETASANLYKEKAIRGFCHLCSGQEAVYSGNRFKPEDHEMTVIFYQTSNSERSIFQV